MKKNLSHGIPTIFVVCVACAYNLAAQTEIGKNQTQQNKQTVAIREITSAKKAASSVVAPDECLQTFRAFFSYVQRAAPDIAGDSKAQERWLSQNLRKDLAKKIEIEDREAKRNPTDKREYPSNADFVGAWDYPSTFSVVGSRLYNERAIIDIVYEWGDKTNYPGHKRLSSFIFIRETGAWKLDDVYTFRGEFESAESLSDHFRREY